MDHILAQILICNIAVRRELARLEKPMTPKLNGIAAAMAKLNQSSAEALPGRVYWSIKSVEPATAKDGVFDLVANLANLASDDA